jgi:hypothetical protein
MRQTQFLATQSMNAQNFKAATKVNAVKMKAAPDNAMADH